VYSRAGLSRTVTLVVAPSLTAVSTGAVAREFRAADTESDAADRSNVAAALIGTFVPAVNVAAYATPVPPQPTAVIDAEAQLDTATARPIQRIRKME
jgi:hypothetical protein